MIVVLGILFVIVPRTISQDCDHNNSVVLINKTIDSVQHKDREYFADNTTCVCMKKTCIRKCCPLGQGYDAGRKICINTIEEFDPPVWEGFAVKPGFNVTTEFNLLFYKMACSSANNEFRISLIDVTKDFHLKTDGKLYVKVSVDQPSHEYNVDKYCIDNFVYENDQKKIVSTEINALICYIEKVQKNHYAVTASCMLISCFFIILTVSVYAFLRKLRNLQGKVMIIYLLNLFVGLLFMATMQILLLVDNITQPYCLFMTFVIYFFILAAFLWLNVLCYDLWSKLRSNKNMAHGFATSPCRLLSFYSAYAFGIPTSLTILLAALEFSNLPVDIKLLPHLRRQGCFIYGMSKLLYLYTPILAACMVNLILFILTARILTQMKKQTEAVRKDRDSQRFWLYFKLFIVTGINWILEVLSSFYPEANKFWQYTDAYNVLVGLIIFIIFVCKKTTFISLRHRYQTLMGMPMSQTDMTKTRTSSCPSSQISHSNSQTKSTFTIEPESEKKRTTGSSVKNIRKAFTAYVHTR